MFGLTALLILGAGVCFYHIAFRSLCSKEERYTYNIQAQVARRMEDITISIDLLSDSVASSTATKSLLQETSSVKRWEYQRTLSTLVSDIADSNPNISNIILLNDTREVYTFSGTNYSLVSKLNARYDLFSGFSHPDGFTGVLYDSIDETPYFCHIQTVFDNLGTKIGTCLILCNCESLQELCNNTRSTEQSLFMILDADGQVIIRGHEAAVDLEARVIDSIHNSDQQMYSDTIDKKSYLLSQYPDLELTGWKVVSATPYAEISGSLNSFRWFAIGFFLVLVIASIMLEQIQEMTNTSFQNQARMYEIKLAHDRARLSALQSQINPHFLYNTLDSIQALSYLGKTDEIRTVISALSTLTRYSIKGDEMVKIREELQCAQKYLSIINIRFPGRFSFCLDVPEEILEHKMPRFLLQPLVENAIFHGLEPRPGEGSLILTGEIKEGVRLHFECRDDGLGIPPEDLASIKKALAETSEV